MAAPPLRRISTLLIFPNSDSQLTPGADEQEDNLITPTNRVAPTSQQTGDSDPTCARTSSADAVVPEYPHANAWGAGRRPGSLPADAPSYLQVVSQGIVPVASPLLAAEAGIATGVETKRSSSSGSSMGKSICPGCVECSLGQTESRHARVRAISLVSHSNIQPLQDHYPLTLALVAAGTVHQPPNISGQRTIPLPSSSTANLIPSPSTSSSQNTRSPSSYGFRSGSGSSMSSCMRSRASTLSSLASLNLHHLPLSPSSPIFMEPLPMEDVGVVEPWPSR